MVTLYSSLSTWFGLKYLVNIGVAFSSSISAWDFGAPMSSVRVVRARDGGVTINAQRGGMQLSIEANANAAAAKAKSQIHNGTKIHDRR